MRLCTLTRFDIPVSILLLIGVLVSAACRGKPDTLPLPIGPPDQGSVRVSTRELMVAFPRDSAAERRWPGVQLSDRFAGPEWRIMIRVDTAWLAGVHVVYPDSALALPSYESLTEVVRAGQLRDCDLDSWILVCGTRLDGATEVLDGRVLLRIRSRAWLSRLRENRPGYAHISRQAPGRQFAYWGDSVAIEYRPK
jgi:hypothetical protein